MGHFIYSLVPFSFLILLVRADFLAVEVSDFWALLLGLDSVASLDFLTLVLVADFFLAVAEVVFLAAAAFLGAALVSFSAGTAGLASGVGFSAGGGVSLTETAFLAARALVLALAAAVLLAYQNLFNPYF